MVVKKPRIVIIGAGMAGLTAANKLYKSGVKKGAFELCVVEGGNRIGGRINTSEFGGDRIEMGATWIHGIGGSPVHKIAQETNSLESDQPWECMDGFLDDHHPITIAENGYVLNPSLVDPISNLFKNLMCFSQGKIKSLSDGIEINLDGYGNGNGIEINLDGYGNGNGIGKVMSVGCFLRKGLDAYWKLELESRKESEEVNGCGEWNRKLLQESIFAMQENTQRTYTAANDLFNLDYKSESEYVMFPGEEITIAKGYSSIIESLASVLPSGVIQLGKKVYNIEWQPDSVKGINGNCHFGSGSGSRPVKIHFLDGTTISADHVIVTVSLGVLKSGTNDSGSFRFDPPLPSYKNEAISRLGFGVVNKLFLKLSPEFDLDRFPFLQLVFHKSDLEIKNPKIPWWMRRTASVSPIYERSRVLLSWFAGDEALKLESLPDEVVLDEVSATISSFLSNSHFNPPKKLKFEKVLKSGWGTDPLFMGSYSYIAVGSSGADIDSLAEPLPETATFESTTTDGGSGSPTLQILFAGEATHRTHYSTTHGAYFSGLREANRLLQHYHCIDV